MKAKILGYSIGPVGAGLLGLLTLPLLTWFYSVEDIGRISMLQVASSFLVLLFCLGLDQAYTREYYETSNKLKLFKQAIVPGLFLLMLCLILFVVLGLDYISYWLYGVSSKTLSVITIACFLMAFCSRFLSLILRMEDKAVAYSMSQLLPKLFFVIFVGVSVLLGLNANFDNLILAHMLAVSLGFFVFGWNTRNTWFSAVKLKLDREQNKTLLQFGLPLVLGGLASWGLKAMDSLFLRGMSTFEELGIYSVTISIAGAATIFAGIFNTIWGPMVYRWVHEGCDTGKIAEVSEHVLAAIYFVIILSGLFSWIIPVFLPEKYKAVQYLLPICLLGPLLYTLSETTVVGIAITRKTGYSMLASIIAMLVNMLGNYLLVPEYGAYGAAVSTAIAFFVFYVLRTEFSKAVWQKVSGIKGYIIIFIISVFSFYTGTGAQESNDYIFGWLVFLVIGFFIFSGSVKLITKSVFNLLLRDCK